VGNGELRRLADFGGVFGVQAGGVGLIGVRGEEPRAARAERAINLALDAADGEEVVAGANGAVAVERGCELLVGNAEHHPEAKPEFAGLGHAADGVDSGEW